MSELVREREAIFLTNLEQDIQVLEPAETRLVPDSSPGFADSRLYLESQLRQAVPNDERIHIAQEAAMDPVPYQFQPARQALRQPRQRILIADAVGLGKTLEAGILVSELIARGRGRRILVLAVKSMLTQFQKEFWNRFTIPLTRLDSIGIQRVRSRIPTSHNPFHYYDKAIISIDTLKQDAEYRTYLEQAYWDVIVIDEAHNVADRGTGGSTGNVSHGKTSLRSRLARLLARRSDTLIMLSATPHDGRARSFASLMNMLDATAIADPDNYTQEDFSEKGLVIRRFKKDIRNQVRDAFREREIVRHRFPASAAEEAAYEALLAVKVAPSKSAATSPVSKRRDLFLVTLEKALFSSPAACIASVDQRIRRRERELDAAPNTQVAAEVESLQDLRKALVAIGPDDYAKYRALLAALRDKKPFDWNASDPSDRLVVFTERIETLKWLRDRLAKDLRLSAAQVDILHGGLSDVDQQRVVEDFGNAARPLRLLICSDVASEGINLHYQCHRLIHFDMPWSLMVFQQRNGRVDRYGQERTPHIVYLVTASTNDTIRGDTRILEVLAAKDEQAHRNIGDPSAFMRVYDIEKEEEITRDAIAAGEQADRFDARLTPAPSTGDDLLALFLGTNPPEDDPPAETPELSPAPMSLFESDIAYCETALHRLRKKDHALRFETDVTGSVLTLDAPDDLRRRYGYFPREVFPENGRFALTADRNRMRDAIAESRRDEDDMAEVALPLASEPVGRLAERPHACRFWPPRGAGAGRRAEPGGGRDGVRPFRTRPEPTEPPAAVRVDRRGVPRGTLRNPGPTPGAARRHRTRSRGNREPRPASGHRRPPAPAPGRRGKGPRVGGRAPARLRGARQREAESRDGGAREAEDTPAPPAGAAARTIRPVGNTQAHPGGARPARHRDDLQGVFRVGSGDDDHRAAAVDQGGLRHDRGTRGRCAPLTRIMAH